MKTEIDALAISLASQVSRKPDRVRRAIQVAQSCWPDAKTPRIRRIVVAASIIDRFGEKKDVEPNCSSRMISDLARPRPGEASRAPCDPPRVVIVDAAVAPRPSAGLPPRDRPPDAAPRFERIPLRERLKQRRAAESAR